MPTVLIVEDNALVVQLVEQQLEDLYAVVSAVNGKLGVETARALGPDVVLMDLTMPVMDGWAAIRILRSDASTAALPIVALSASNEPQHVARALAAGADAYLAKPIDEAALKNTIARMLAGSGKWRRQSVPAEAPVHVATVKKS
jgi:CheY-like chemotaxis protein